MHRINLERLMIGRGIKIQMHGTTDRLESKTADNSHNIF